MTEPEVFETRLRTALARHVAAVPGDFDALGFARAVAAAEPRRRGRAGAIAGALSARPGDRSRWWSFFAPPAGRSPVARMAWIVAVLGILVAATISAIYVGSALLRRADELTALPQPTVVLTLPAHTEGVAALAWSPDGTHLATASRAIEGRDGGVKVWDAGTGEELLRFTAGRFETTRVEIAYSPDGTRLALGGPDNAVYDAATGDVIVGELGDRALAYSPDGARIIAGGAWGWAAVVDASTGEELLTLLPGCPSPYSWVWAAAWSPDGTRLATTCRTYVTVWDGATGEGSSTITSRLDTTEERGRLTSVAWSPDGTRIATVAHDTLGGSDGWMAEIWDAATGQELVSIAGRTGDVWVVAWSPDGTRIATAGHAGTAKIWDAASGAELATLAGHAGEVTDVAWSPDGHRIATASEDGTARIWTVPPRPADEPTASPTSAPMVEYPRALAPGGEPFGTIEP